MRYRDEEHQAETDRFGDRVALWLALGLSIAGLACIAIRWMVPDTFSLRLFDMGWIIYASLYSIVFIAVQYLSLADVSMRWIVCLFFWHHISTGVLLQVILTGSYHAEVIFFVPACMFLLIGLLGKVRLTGVSYISWIHGLWMTGMCAVIVWAALSNPMPEEELWYIPPVISMFLYTFVAMAYRYELRDINIRHNEHTLGEVKDAVGGATMLSMGLGVMIQAVIHKMTRHI